MSSLKPIPNVVPHSSEQLKRKRDAEEDDKTAKNVEKKQFLEGTDKDSNEKDMEIQKDRCGRCNRKLSLVDQAQQCKCKRFYCSKHRFGVRLDMFKEDRIDGHACRFDYGGENSQRLDVAMNKVLSNRGLNKI